MIGIRLKGAKKPSLVFPRTATAKEFFIDVIGFNHD